jgi:ATP-dependent Clp protease adapter protein ClpS
MKRVESRFSKKKHVKTKKRKGFVIKKSWCLLRLAEYGREPSLDFFMGITSPYEDEDVLVDDDVGTRIGEPWKVILYNDDIHTFEEVILQLQKALGCGQSRAEKIAFEAHSRGKAIAYDGEFEECFRIMGILREIQLVVEIEG